VAEWAWSLWCPAALAPPSSSLPLPRDNLPANHHSELQQLNQSINRSKRINIVEGKKISHREVHCVRVHFFGPLSQWGLNPIKLAYSPSPPDNGLGQYASSPGNRAYGYAELVVSSLVVAVTMTSTHFAYPRRDGQAELVHGVMVAWLNTKTVYLRKVTHFSTNPAQRRVTSLMRPTMLPQG